MDGELAISVNLSESHQHLVSGDPDIVERTPAIILGIVAHFSAHVTTSDAFEELPSRLISQLNYKRKNSNFLSIDDQLGVADGVAGEESELARPPLGSHWRRCINYKLISLPIESGRCL